MPASHPSRFQNGELVIDQTKFENIYNLGIAQFIVRRYVDAKASFTRFIDDKLIRKETKDLIFPFKQLLLIETKVLKNPDNLIIALKNIKEVWNLNFQVLQEKIFLKIFKKNLRILQNE